jgi:RNA polymerase sigma-70 factor (ECF subfamily)
MPGFGNFSCSRDITGIEGPKQELVQDALPGSVLGLEAKKREAMHGPPQNCDAEKSGTSESDEELMVAFSRGSVDAIGELFSRYRQPVFGFFRRRVADPSQAEELTQETFLAILRASSRYEPRALFRTYLYAIGLKILRASRRKSALRYALLAAKTRHSEPAADNAPDAEILVRQAVGKLERLDREVLMLREFEQLTYAEIAELLNLKVNTVRSRLFRARMALRDLLDAPAPTSSPAQLTESEERA